MCLTHTNELVVSLWPDGGRDGEEFPAPPHFSWKPCDETKTGGRKRNALCDVCKVCDTCVLPEAHCFTSLCEILFRLWFGLRLVCFLSILVCSLPEHFLYLSSLALEVCLRSFCICAVEMFRVGLFHLLTVSLGLLVCCFCRLTPTPVLYGISGVCLDESRLTMVPPFTKSLNKSKPIIQVGLKFSAFTLEKKD